MNMGITTSRGIRRIQNRFAKIEQLEARSLLAFAISDLYPLESGQQWNFSGTANGRSATAVMSSAGGFSEGGALATRLRTTITTSLGSTIDARYFVQDSQGLRLVRRDLQEGGSSQIERFTTPLRVAPVSFDAGTVQTYNGTASATTNGLPWTETASGSVTFSGEESVVTPAGTFRAVRFTRVGTLTGQGNGWTATGSTTETQWVVRGVGIVRIEYSQTEQFSDGSVQSDNLDLSLTSSTLLSARTGFLLTGMQVPISRGDTTPSSADGTIYGAFDVAGETKTRSFRITNTSQRTMTVGSISITGANAQEFWVSRAPASSLEPGESTVVNIRFDPAGAGARFANVSIANSDPLATPFVFAIRGTGVLTSRIEIRRQDKATAITNGDSTPTPIEGTAFGRVPRGGTASITRVFVISNPGLGGLTLTGSPRVRITGPNGGDFAIVAQPSQTIGSGGSALFSVRFTPNALGGRYATIEIASDARGAPLFSFTIVGTGV